MNQDAFIMYLEEQINECRQNERQLASDDRCDEAVFEKIRANVYDIFKTVYAAAQRIQGAGPEKTHIFFLQKLEDIPANWHASLGKAREYGDEDKIHLEQLKLETAERIKAEYLRLQEVAL